MRSLEVARMRMQVKTKQSKPNRNILGPGSTYLSCNVLCMLAPEQGKPAEFSRMQRAISGLWGVSALKVQAKAVPTGSTPHGRSHTLALTWRTSSFEEHWEAQTLQWRKLIFFWDFYVLDALVTPLWDGCRQAGFFPKSGLRNQCLKCILQENRGEEREGRRNSE